MSPKTLERGMHSKSGSLKKIITKGVSIPPPPRPPAFASIDMNVMTTIPISSKDDGGQLSSFN